MIGNTVVAEYPDTGIFPITVITKSSAGNDTLTIQNRIVVLPKPKPGIAGETIFCTGEIKVENYFPDNIRLDRKYEWRVDNHPTQGYPQPLNGYWMVWEQGGGKITLIETILATGCSDSISKEIVFIKSPDTEFTYEIDTMCPNTIQTYTRTTQDENSTYFWNVSYINILERGRSILDTTENSVTVQWEKPGLFAVDLFGKDTVTQCTTLTRKFIYVQGEPIPIISPIIDTMCVFNRKTYFNANYKPTSTYNWSATNGRIIYQDADSAIIQWFGEEEGIVTLTETFEGIPCPGSSSRTQPLKTNPNKPTVVRTGNLLTASMANSYQWYFNQNRIPGATQSTFTITEEGLYSVYATYENGTCGAFSDIVSTITSVAETAEPNYSIQPNPTSGIFRFSSYFDQNTILSIDVISSMGIPMQTYSKIEAKGTFQKELNCTTLPTGVYFLRIQSNQRTRYIPFIKQ